jgi:predicted DNA binding CopG/RHH family protein
MAKPTSQMTDEEILRESDKWDKLSIKDIASIWNEAEATDIAFVDKRSPKKAVSIRIREDMIDETKQLAASLGIGYQALFKLWIAEGLGDWRSRYARRASPSRRRAPSKSRRKTTA